ncbi:MAG: hypothetical protein KDK62_02380 [Chlamydiia bacterium]|nr:hypothetical protein [Chlamydiia bacterium]
MLSINELKSLITDLQQNKVTEFSLAGSVVTLKVSDSNKAINLSAPVYWGGNFIPISVREAIKKRPPFDDRVIETYLTLDDEAFQVILHYDGQAQAAKPEVFGALMDEFGYLVDHWREWLDEKDRDDLVHVVNRP